MSAKHAKNFPQSIQPLNADAESNPVQAPLTESAALTNQKLLYELQAHQLELEKQNEELRQAHVALEAARDRYINLYEFAPIGYLTLTAKAIIAEINLTAAKLLGVERGRLIDRRFAEFVAEKDKENWHRLFLSALADTKGETHCFDLQLKSGGGSMIYAHFECLRHEEAGASPVLRLALADISRLKQAEDELRIADTIFKSQDGIFITDANGVILKVNQAFTTISGYSAEEAIGQTPRLFKSGLHNAEFYAAIWESIKNTGVWYGEIYNSHKNGEIYPEQITISAVQGSEGEVLHYVGRKTDIRQQTAASRQIEQLVFYDSLTHLPNRQLLKDRLDLALSYSAGSKRRGALLFIDLDHFKILNDTLGHDLGDLLLQQVAQRLISFVREDDTVARLGGDEFAVLLENLNGNPEDVAIHADIIGKKIRAGLNQPYRLAGHIHQCTVSIGATMFDGLSVSVEELLKQVDIALYQAKRTGRNTLCFFEPAMQTVLVERAALEANLRLALNNNEFQLYYQMQATHDGHAVGAEALIRWQHPVQGLVSPLEFISLAEETGLILAIGDWVLETACAQLKRWENNPQAMHLQLAVNVSAYQFHQPGFFEHVRAILEKTAIRPELLKLELTEGMVLTDIDDTIGKMNMLKSLGVQFSLDDFGTGYSSLSYLTQLPLDQLKIDQSFIRNIGVKHTDAVIVKTIIGMAKILGMDVIAEGVETEAQRAFLEQFGCLLCQGYLFSKPVPLEAFEQLLYRAGW